VAIIPAETQQQAPVWTPIQFTDGDATCGPVDTTCGPIEIQEQENDSPRRTGGGLITRAIETIASPFVAPGRGSPFSQATMTIPREPTINQGWKEDTGKWILIECRTYNRPAPGSQTVTLEGQIVIQCGQGIKTTEHKDIPLNGTGKFEVGGISITVEKTRQGGGMIMLGGWLSDQEEGDMNISLISNRSLDSFIKFTFLDADGNEIRSRRTGSGASIFPVGRAEERHTTYFQLAEEVDSLTIRLEMYEKLETITLPFSLNVGLGL
jgi:hypothetical protein